MWQIVHHVLVENTAINQGSRDPPGHVLLVISASMQLTQTNLRTMITSPQVTVCALQILLEENAKKASSVLRVRMSQPLVQEGFTALAKERMQSLQSVMQDGFVLAELRCLDHQMESLGTSAHQGATAPRVPKFRSFAQ